MNKHFEKIEDDSRRLASLQIPGQIPSDMLSLGELVNAVPAKRSGISDPWRIAQRALRLLANSRRTIVEQEDQIAQLKSLSESDELTGLLNRRGLLKGIIYVFTQAGIYAHLM